MAYEVQVHEDGDAEVRAVPKGHTSVDTLVFDTVYDVRQELTSYGHDKEVVDAACEKLKTEAVLYQWVKV